MGKLRHPRVVVHARLSWDGRVLDRLPAPAAAPLDPRLLAGLLARLARHYAVAEFTALGGSPAARALFAAGLVDEIHLRLQPRILGGAASAPTLTGAVPFVGGSSPFLTRSLPCRLVSARPVGRECLLRYRVQKSTMTNAPA